MFSAGFYYKTFMWPKAAWKTFYEPNIRAAAGLGVAPDQPDPDHYSVALRPLRGAGARRRRGRHRRRARGGRERRARHPLRRAGRVRRRAALREPAPGSTASDGWTWAQAAVAKLAAMDNVRVLPRTTAFGYYAQNFVGLVERVSDHLAEPGDDAAARAAVAGARQARDPRHRRHRAAHGVCRQRPAGRHAGLGGAHLPQPLWRRGRQECRRLHGQRFRLCRGDRPEEGRRRHRRRSSTCATIRPVRRSTRRARSASRSTTAAPWSAPAAGCASPR